MRRLEMSDDEEIIFHKEEHDERFPPHLVLDIGKT